MKNFVHHKFCLSFQAICHLVKKYNFGLFFITLLLLIHCSACSQNHHSSKEIPICCRQAKPIKNVQVALVLGTGGLRGIAHLAVLEVLEKEGIPIDLIVGTSAGSFIGAFYCANPNVKVLKEQLMGLKKEDLIGSFFNMSSGKALEHCLYKNLKTCLFHELKIPLIVVTTSLTDNEVSLIQSGSIPLAVQASSAIPMFFSPVKCCHESLTDGGVLAPVPVEIAELYNPKLIIAVNLTAQPELKPVKKQKDVFSRAIDISYYEFSKIKASKADIVIHPLFVGTGSFEKKSIQESYEKGLIAAKKAIPKIKEEMKLRGIALKNCPKQ